MHETKTRAEDGPSSTGDSIRLEFQPQSPCKTEVRALRGERVLYAHSFDPRNANARSAYAKAVVGKAADAGLGPIDPGTVDARLLEAVGKMAEAAEADDPGPAAYRAVEGDPDPERDGIYLGDAQLSNFVLEFVEDVIELDDGHESRRFRARVTRNGETAWCWLTPQDLAVPTKLREAILGAAGPKAQILGHPDVLCRAAAALSDPRRRTVVNAFGWDEGGTVYRSPSAWVDAHGIHAAGVDDPVRVDLGAETCARHLGLLVPADREVDGLRRHVVDDLLRLAPRRVTYALLASVALAILVRFAPAMNRPALWLLGVTGTGKSFLARLFANFFGDFGLSDGSRLGSWGSTGNSLQRQGYYFRDAVFLIDDYKPDAGAGHREVVRLLQNYADNSARARLRSDATANVTRPMRCLLVSTGEDRPEHAASAAARTLTIAVPRGPKDFARGGRCRGRCGRYPALTADLIRHLLAAGRTAGFAVRVEAYLEHFLEGIAGRQNDARIAGNLALLAAAFAEFAGYLADAWTGWEGELAWFIRDLEHLRDEMLAEVEGQQASEVFLAAFRALVDADEVCIKGVSGGPPVGREGRPTVGRLIQPARGPRVVEVATQMALRAVQEHLRRSGKPPLPATEKALVAQLAGDGKLLGRDGRPLAGGEGGDRTWSAKIDGKARNVFCLASSELIDEPMPGPRTPPPFEPSTDDDGDAEGDAPHGHHAARRRRLMS